MIVVEPRELAAPAALVPPAARAAACVGKTGTAGTALDSGGGSLPDSVARRPDLRPRPLPAARNPNLVPLGVDGNPVNLLLDDPVADRTVSFHLEGRLSAKSHEAPRRGARARDEEERR